MLKNTLKSIVILGALGSTLSFAKEAVAEIVFSEVIPPESFLGLYDAPKMCYKGDPLGVVPALQKIMDENDRLSIDTYMIAFRVERHLTIYDTIGFFETGDADLKEEMETNNPEEVKAWRTYKTDSKTVLVLSNLGPQGDGTELYATSIKPCPRERLPR